MTSTISSKKHKKIKAMLCLLILIIALLAAFLAYMLSGNGDWITQTSYLQSTEEIYYMEAGILYNALEFRDGEDFAVTYDFDNPEYPELKSKYGIEATAGEGTELDKAKALMNEYSGRLRHKSDYDNHVEMNALALLEYSLDNKKQGINCRAKAQILNEMCLVLGICSRKVWICPNSVYDTDCHVVNEVWDSSLNKWVMLDITNNYYWVDESGTPLSVLEIREHIANQKFCTPVSSANPLDTLDKLTNLEKSLNRNYENFLYIAKNMVFMKYCGENTVGEGGEFYSLVPEAITYDTRCMLISRESIEASPVR